MNTFCEQVDEASKKKWEYIRVDSFGFLLLKSQFPHKTINLTF